MELRFRLFALIVVAGIAAAAWTFPAWRGYFLQRGADAAFPDLPLELQADFLSLPADERRELIAMHAANPATALEMTLLALKDAEAAPPDQISDTTLGAAQVLATGEFQELDALHWGAGTATVYELPDARRILRLEAFSSAPGNDLRVYLAHDPMPLSALQLGSDFLDLGRLKGNVGNQSYFLPANHDLTVYNSAAVFDRHFNRVVTVARLR